MSKSKMNDNLKKQHATDSFATASPTKAQSIEVKISKDNYQKPDGVGRAGAIINITISVLNLVIVFILFAFTTLFLFTELLFSNSNESEKFISWLFLIILFVFFLFLGLLISNIISSTKFLKGKNNKVSAGILSLLTLNLISAVFILVSEKEKQEEDLSNMNNIK